MQHLFRILSFAIPLALLVGVGAMYGGGLLNRGDYTAKPGMTADPPSAFTDGRPNLVGAMFYSAWCGSCAVLEPKLREVIPGFEGRAVEFTKFDFSMGQPDALMDKATDLGVDRVYAQYKGATGFLALIDRRTQAEIGRITMSMSDSAIRDEINRAIAAVSAPPLGGA